MWNRLTGAVKQVALVAVVLILVVAAGGVALRLADRATASEEAAHRSDRLQLASSLATLANGYFSQLAASQVQASQSLAGGKATPARLAETLSSLPGQPAAVMVGPSGAAAVVGPGASALAAALPAVDAADRGSGSTVGPLLTLSGRPVLAVAAGSVGGDRLVVGYRLDALPIAVYVQQLRIGPAAVPYVVDPAGRLVTTPVPAGIGTRAPALVRRAAASAGATVVQLGAGPPVVAAVVPVGLAGWKLVVVQPAPQFYGTLWHADTTIRWAVFALLVVVAAALLLLHNKRQAALHAIARMAVTDALTGLPNRVAFTRALGRAVERHRRDGTDVALLFCDLDGFKAVNDQFGHDAGDLLLVAAGRRLSEVTGTVFAGPALLARLGGDEFTVLLEGRHGRARAASVAEAVTAAMAEPFQLGSVEVLVGVSVGVAFAQPGRDLLHDADLAMYRTKAVRRAARRAGEPDHPSGWTGGPRQIA